MEKEGGSHGLRNRVIAMAIFTTLVLVAATAVITYFVTKSKFEDKDALTPPKSGAKPHAAITPCPQPTTEKPMSDFSAFEKKYMDFLYKYYPEYKFTTGVSKDSTLYNSDSIQTGIDIHKDALKLLEGLRNMDISSLNEDQVTRYDIIKARLKTYEDGWKWRDYGGLNPVSSENNPFAYLIPGMFRNITNFSNFQRLLSYMKMVDIRFREYNERMQKAIKVNRTNHKDSMAGIVESTNEFLQNSSDIKNMQAYVRVKKALDTSSLTPSKKYTALRSVETFLRYNLIPTMKKFSSTLENYMKNLRRAHGLHAWKNGKEFYESLLKYYIGSGNNASTVHKLGLNEIKRIQPLLKQIMKNNLNFTGTIAELFAMLGNDQNQVFSTQDEVLNYYKDTYKNLTTKVKTMFPEDMFQADLDIIPTATDHGIAYYNRLSDNGILKSYFYINNHNPTKMLKLNAIALTLHEAEPGHHLQITANLKRNLPPYLVYPLWDYYYKAPFAYTSFYDFIEGWGLYSEYLGTQMDAYKTHYDLIGRYQFELWRAARLVVDTGIHYMGWSKDKAVKYFVTEAGTSQKVSEGEISRYIAMPGQATCYKIGELRLHDIRKKAKNALGEKFNSKVFHSAILKSGSAPFNVIEKSVNNYIAKTLKANT